MEKICVIFVIFLIHYSKGQPDCTGDDYQEFKGSCFYFGSEPRTWEEAKQDCRNRGSTTDLTLIPDAGVQTFLQDIIHKLNWDRTWIGLREARTDWHWVRGSGQEDYHEFQGCYKFNYVNPSDMSHSESITEEFTVAKCKKACFDRQFKYAGTVISQTDGRSPLCKCGDDYDWKETQTGCRTKCHDTSTEFCGSIHKIIMYRLKGTSLNIWKKDQPNDFDGYQRCLSLSDGNYKWADEECGDENPSLCEYNKAEAACVSSGYSFHSESGKCYSQNTGPSNWYKARTDCRDHGGDLLRTDSMVVWDHISSILPAANRQRWWIGGTSHRWFWSNGAGLSYTNWAVAQPDERGEGCGCISRNTAGINYQWEDQPCTNKFQYVCQIATPPTTTPSATPPTTTPRTTQSTPSVPTRPGGSGTNPNGGGDTTGGPLDADPASSTGDEIIPKGVIVAIVVAGLAVLVGLVRLIVYCYQRSRRQQKTKTEELIYHEPFDVAKDFENPGYVADNSVKPSKKSRYIKNKTPNGNASHLARDDRPPSVSSMVVGEVEPPRPDETLETGSDMVYAY